jgi:hypothetical protein
MRRPIRIQISTPGKIIILVAVLAAAALMMAGDFQRARHNSQTQEPMVDLRQLDAAVQQYILESGTSPRKTTNDLFGDTYGPFTIDSIPEVEAKCYTGLSDVVPISFWSPY